MLFVGTSIIHPSTEGVFLLCNILDLLIYSKEIIPSYWIDLDKIDTFSDTNTAIKDFFEQQQAQFVCGELDIDNDADWQAYVDGMYSLGLEDWVATQGIEEIAK